MTGADRRGFARLTDGGRIRHQPGLDGLRGMAVAAVLVFHSGLGWLPGGYLGVSLFFTLSGTLIGTVLLHEIDTRGTFSLRRFWGRRARRLLPAAWVVLAVVGVVRVTSTVFSATTGSDLLASWLQVANWHFLAADRSYADLFGGPSAVLHFWSLAIEEQFYVVVGVGAVVLARRSSRPAEHLAIASGTAAVVSFALPVVLGFGVDRTYYGTDTRAGELLVGLALAGVIADGRRRRRILAARRPLAVVAVVALVAALVLWRVLDTGDPGLRTWVLPMSALVSTCLVLGALVPGPVSKLMGWRPLRWLGGISYALYLVHWPVFVAVRRADPGAGVAVLAVATVVALGLAVLSTSLVEAPVRTRRLPVEGLRLGAAALVGCLVLTAVVPARRTAADQLLRDLETAAASGGLPAALAPGAPSTAPMTSSAPTTGATSDAPPADPPAPGPAPPAGSSTSATVAPAADAGDGVRPIVGLFGDSIAFSLAFALAHSMDEAHFIQDGGLAEFGCGVALSPYATGVSGDPCESMIDRMAARVRERGLDGVVVVSCQWELLTQPLPGETEPRSPGDPVFDAYVRDAYREAAETLRAAGATHVMWVRCPTLSSRVTPPDLSDQLRAAREPGRVAAINAVVDELAAAGVVQSLDLASWVAPRVDDPALRADGAHFVYDEDTGVSSELTRLVDDAIAA